MQKFETKEPTYDKVIENIDVGVALKITPSEGNLAYEYNPLRNYRVQLVSYRYNNKLLTPKELLIELKLIEEDSAMTDLECLNKINGIKDWSSIIPESLNNPVLVESGELTDFETDELTFDINHPVDILPQYSYDNSVNLILNDGKNTPRLINSRFSTVGKNKYLIVDRKGNNDTNIYDLGSLFDIDTSLYKRVVEIPRLRFVGTTNGGKLPVGNYHFYFKYADADGNETDFVAESGLVSMFVGNDPSSIRTGFRDEDSHKSVLFLLTNVDSAYLYVVVYYTRATSDINQNSTIISKKIEQKFLVNNFLKCNIIITGYEDEVEVTTSEINPQYQIADSVLTLEQCLNRLFLGNIRKPEIPYTELEDLSLRFLPYLEDSEDYPLTIDKDYNIKSSSRGYYDSKYIYNNVGYWNHEIYRFGIVYIMSNNSLSPVFNIRGIDNLSKNTQCSIIPMYYTNGGIKYRNHIITEEDTYKIVTDPKSYENVSQDLIISSGKDLENSKGVISLEGSGYDTNKVFAIGIRTNREVLDYLKDKLKIKGFFFVRLKRIPTILCLAYTIGIDKESRTPVLPILEGYLSERFINDDRILTHDFDSRLYKFTNKGKVRTLGAICPEYDIDSSYLNSVFTGDKFTILESDILPLQPFLDIEDDRNFLVKGSREGDTSNTYNVKIIGVEDNTKLVAINDYMFSARAGEAEEAFRYEYLERENKVSEASNLIRGSFGPYLGITGYSYSGKLIDIKIPGFGETSEGDLFKIRYNDKSPFFAVSDRISLSSIEDWFTGTTSLTLTPSLHRGDCYICLFTHRVNRNFQDPSAPTNDRIVDLNCWKDNYEIIDNVLKVDNFEKINLGDVNAIKLGMWITLTVRSTKNLNIRSVDDSIPDEISLTGHSRGYYPLQPISPEGSYKTPEALCYNKGFEKSLSERYNFEVPDVPAIKNDFTNRIAYSDIHVNDAFKNGFRVFQGTHYRDYPKTYGEITKLVELRGSILCIFEHGIALIPINERAIAGEGSGGNIYINTSNVLPENPKIISDTFGSQWKDSVIKTPSGVYGVDTVGKKIWRTNGEIFECLSDFKVLEFLNNNITLTERENNPVIGIRNVKTHYNAYKHDVMFTFYDNLQGFEEKVWNLCYNELMLKWITFYSWIPSYSENIYNQYFSFDRNTSKWITKLGISHSDNNFSDGIVLSSNTIPNSAKAGYCIGKLGLANRTLPTGSGIQVKIEYLLEKDNFGNYDNFKIRLNDGEYYLYLDTDAINLCSELFVRGIKEKDSYNKLITDPTNLRESWILNCVLNNKYTICKDDRGKRLLLGTPPYGNMINSEKLVSLLNIKAKISVEYTGQDSSLAEAYSSGFVNGTKVDAGYYQSVVAVIPEYNLLFLTTDFWKHGQSGIIDISDKIYPTYWYGKLHPFEFEFVVADKPSAHKIFDDLEIISNNAEPDSFHYEIIGDCFDFAKDKKNMYIRLEATKELYLNNGFDVLYDHDYIDLLASHRPLYEGAEIRGLYDRSTILPLYYSRLDTINEVEDYYHMKDNVPTKNFSALAGGEIIKYTNLGEYRIWNHAKAVDLQSGGRLRGNMLYREDKWNVLINPINVVYKNEKSWGSEDLGLRSNLNHDKIPIEIGQSPIPNEVLDYNGGTLKIPENSLDRAIVKWNWEDSQMKEVKLKDKWIKIRIRYKGDKLAIITAIKTLYSISY